MPLLDRDFVDPDHAWCRRPCAPQLFAHVNLVEIFNCTPIQVHASGNILDGHDPAEPPDLQSKAVGKLCNRRQETEFFLFHATGLTVHTAHLEVEIDLTTATTEVTGAMPASVIEAARSVPATAAGRFF